MDNILNIKIPNKKILFNYIFILLLFIFIFNKFEIKLNFIFGIFIAVLIILYSDKYTKNEINNNNNIKQTKINHIRPPLSNNITEYNNIVDFLFSIQEFYSYSPANYQDMVDNIDNFFILYNQSNKIPKVSGINYTIAQKYKSKSLNSLQTLIFSLPSSVHKYYIDKLDRATEQLDFMLSSYLQDIYTINDNYVKSNDININTKFLNNNKDDKPKPSNYFEELNLDDKMKLSKNVTLELY